MMMMIVIILIRFAERQWLRDVGGEQERTGSSNQPWLNRQTGLISSGVELGGTPAQIFKYSPPSLAKGRWVPSSVHSLLTSLPLCDCPSLPHFRSLPTLPL